MKQTNLKEAGSKILEQEAVLAQKDQEIATLAAKVKDQCSELQRYSLLEKEKNEYLLEIQNKEKTLKYQTTVICQLQRKTTQLEAELTEAQRKASKEKLLQHNSKTDTIERSTPIGAELSTFSSVQTPHLDHPQTFSRTALMQQMTTGKSGNVSPNYAASIQNDEASNIIVAKEDSAAYIGVRNIQQAANKTDDRTDVEKTPRNGIKYPAVQSLQPNEKRRHPIPILAPSTYFSSVSKMNK